MNRRRHSSGGGVKRQEQQGLPPSRRARIDHALGNETTEVNTRPSRANTSNGHGAGIDVALRARAGRTIDVNLEPILTEPLDPALAPLHHGHRVVEGRVEIEVVDLDQRAETVGIDMDE